MGIPFGEELAMLVADVPWGVVHAALNATGGGERFEIGSAVDDGLTWEQSLPARNVSTLLVGEHQGRSYIFVAGSTIAPTHPDRVVALAAATGRLVLAHEYFDTTGTGVGVAARGDRLLRYVAEGDGVHVEGNLLQGETEEDTIASTSGFTTVLNALGFDVDAWLEHGAKWEVTWNSLDPDSGPEELTRLYRGPVRMRSMWIEESALEEMGWRPDWWPEGGAPRPGSEVSDN